MTRWPATKPSVTQLPEPRVTTPPVPVPVAAPLPCTVGSRDATVCTPVIESGSAASTVMVRPSLEMPVITQLPATPEIDSS